MGYRVLRCGGSEGLLGSASQLPHQEAVYWCLGRAQAWLSGPFGCEALETGASATASLAVKWSVWIDQRHLGSA